MCINQYLSNVKKYLILLPILCISAIVKAQTDTVINVNKTSYKHVDIIARFTQGDFKNYIASNLQYNHHVENTIKGLISLIMEIEADGRVSHVKILKSLSPQIDQEVLHIVSSSPKWEPAMLNGQKVSMQMIFNINIVINGTKTNPPVKENQKTNNAVTNNTVSPIDKKPIFSTAKNITSVTHIPAVVKKDIPPILKNTAHVAHIPAITKKTIALTAKTEYSSTIKKTSPVPPVVKRNVPLNIKKTTPLVAKKTIPFVKKEITPIVIAKKVPVKKTIPSIPPKPILPVAKKASPGIAKKKGLPVIKIAPKTITSKKTLLITKKTKPIVKKKKVDIFNAVSSQPMYPGGITAFHKYLGENVQYPAKSKLNNIEGVVNVRFVIEKDGSISNVEIISSPADDLGQEAIRVLLASPKWKPAMQNGIAVSYKYTITINFTLQNKP